MEGVAARPSLPLQLRFPSQRCLFGRVVSAQRRTQKRGARIDIDARAFARRLGPNICHLRYVRHGRSDSLTARMGIKWIESFESQVDLPAEKKAELETLLYNATFCKQVSQFSGCLHNLEGCMLWPNRYGKSCILYRTISISPSKQVSLSFPAQCARMSHLPRSIVCRLPKRPSKSRM